MKTEASQKPVPLDGGLAVALRQWGTLAINRPPEDRVFASARWKGQQPYWPETPLKHFVQPAARRVGITKQRGWRTFRRTLATLLKGAVEDLNTMQRLTRRANSRMTLDVYAQALSPAKRAAHLKVVELIQPGARTPFVPSCSHAEDGVVAAVGGRFLAGSGEAAVVSIGPGGPEIGRAMAEQWSQIAFAHTSQFHTAPAEKLAERLLAMAPPNFRNGGRVYFTSGGSEATETAIKLARQFHLAGGQKDRYRVLSRRQSYHGSPLGAMSVSGNVARRAPYEPLIAEWGHVAPCFCYHCPFDKTFPQCEIPCPDELELHLLLHEPENTAAFIFEPVVGATLGAAVPPEGYTVRIAEICRKNGILLIADEVMSGMGRTGKPFAVQHWGIEPDMILTGKGVASGYAPLGAVLVSSRVVEAFERG